MKQKLLAITALFIGALGFAQYEGYNTWSIDANGGLSSFNSMLIGTGTVYPAGYVNGGLDNGIRTQNDGFNLNPLHLNLGVRKMFSPSLGLRLGLSYDNIKNVKDFAKYDATFMGANAQVYLNLNKMANTSLLWNRLNILPHFGGGWAMFDVDDKYSVDTNYSSRNKDNLFNIMAGITAQFRILDRLALTADVTNNWYGSAHMMLDGSRVKSNKGYIDSSVMNVSAGLTFYLGKNKQHIDWYEKPVEEKKEEKEVKDYGPTIEDLQNRIKALEARPAADPSALQNRIKELENQIKNLNNSTKQMMDANIIHAYFDFDKDQPKSSSDRDIQTAIDYMKNNPSATMELVGYADNIGTAAYNENLSKRRVENVKNFMVKAGIDASRLSVSWKGSKGSDQSTAEERALARKVVFRVK